MKYFDVIDGRFEIIRPWPKSLTKKRALQLSIRKWEVYVEFHRPGEYFADGAGETCALCQLYAEDFYCKGCPVAEYVDDHGCLGTPYAKRFSDPKLELDFLKEVYLDKYGEGYP